MHHHCVRTAREVLKALLRESSQFAESNFACSSGGLSPPPSVARVAHSSLPQADYEGSILAYTKCLELGYHREYVATFNRGWSREENGDFQVGTRRTPPLPPPPPLPTPLPPPPSTTPTTTTTTTPTTTRADGWVLHSHRRSLCTVLRNFTLDAT